MRHTASKLHSHLTYLQTTTGVIASEPPELMAADLLLSVTDFMGELILIYRCWLLWDRKYWIIIFPSLCAIGGLGMS